MINFRYHVVSLTAVFLALAIGLVVGTAALNGPVADSLRDQVTALSQDNSNLRDQQNQFREELNRAQDFATEVVAGAAQRQADRPQDPHRGAAEHRPTTPTGDLDADRGRRGDHRQGRPCRTSSSTRATTSSCSTWPSRRRSRPSRRPACRCNSYGVETSSALLAAGRWSSGPRRSQRPT